MATLKQKCEMHQIKITERLSVAFTWKHNRYIKLEPQGPGKYGDDTMHVAQAHHFYLLIAI